jgi:hypothetical protein
MVDAIQEEVNKAHYKYDIPWDDVRWEWNFTEFK